MDKRLCVYTIILVILLIVSLFISKTDDKDLIKWFDFGNKKIVSLKYESDNLSVDIVKQDKPLSKERLKDLKGVKNKDVYFVKYSPKDKDSVLLPGKYDLNIYLDSYSPFKVEKSFEADNLESFGIKESSGPKITIQYEGGISKTILIGNKSFDNIRAYYYDPERKSVLIQKTGLVESLIDALNSLVSYAFSDTKSQDVSRIKIVSSNKEKTLYKVITHKDSKELPSWSLTPQGEANDQVVVWIGSLVLMRAQNYLNIEDNEVEIVMSVSMLSDKDEIIESIEIAKYKDGYVGKTNYTGSWVSLGKEDIEKILSYFDSL